ncbi:hypothetical protein [uncultured Dysgonomonas sp.]|uniref:Uncharacterized protein n=1 Tax=uncultured Dysgonomonas sp. TaxID=206096 RepID=A0A212JA40_9BACT|nr:hypothetical protein [uncultured Dysgonomonas sp.]SBV96095.1 conserved hypothetical protein [uncultured Dysgonomonas sp.]
MKLRKKGPHSNRTKHLLFSLNEEEYALISSYIKKYKIANRSRWCRETLIAHVLKSLDQDYPTLFGENEMRR